MVDSQEKPLENLSNERFQLIVRGLRLVLVLAEKGGGKGKERE